jgi:hypothetical protein
MPSAAANRAHLEIPWPRNGRTCAAYACGKRPGDSLSNGPRRVPLAVVTRPLLLAHCPEQPCTMTLRAGSSAPPGPIAGVALARSA